MSDAQEAIDQVVAEIAEMNAGDPEIVVVEEKHGHPILKAMGFLMLLGVLAAAATAILRRGSSDEDWNAV
jgi:hypothetical protein